MTIRALTLAAVLLVACLPVKAQTASTDASAAVLKAPVQYPPAAVWAGEEGTAMVVLEVDTNGHARDASIHGSSGYPRLDDAALRSVAQWSFRPAVKDGKLVAQRLRVPVAFQLERNAGAIAAPSGAMGMTSSLLALLGSLVWLVGFGWSVVLAKRRSILWLSCMVAVWIVTYPVFVAMHWSGAKRSLAVVLGGIILFSLGLYLSPSVPLR